MKSGCFLSIYLGSSGSSLSPCLCPTPACLSRNSFSLHIGEVFYHGNNLDVWHRSAQPWKAEITGTLMQACLFKGERIRACVL